MRTVIRIVLLWLIAAVGAAASASPAAPGAQTAMGKGSMTFGHEGEGVAYFEFNIGSGPETTGTLLFAGEHHDHFPDVVVRVAKIDRARFGRGWVRFAARGALHDEPVRVTGIARDGAAAGTADRLSLTCTDAKGRVVLEADGELFRGDIVIGTPE